jgi:hypothetical protein
MSSSPSASSGQFFAEREQRAGRRIPVVGLTVVGLTVVELTKAD